MPHCVIDASATVQRLLAPDALVRLVHDVAADSGLFKPGEVKVRLNLFEHFCVGGEQNDFVHLIFYVLEGRTAEQKKSLSLQIVRALVAHLPTVDAISLDVRDIERGVFSNKRSCV